MQFNLVNDQEQVAQFVQHGVAWRSVALHGISIMVISSGGGGACSVSNVAVY